MSFIKIGQSLDIQASDIVSEESVLSDPQIIDRFQKFALNLKRIAPKASDFLYFSCIMMNAAEAALLNDDGSIKLTASGIPITASWEKKGESWKWVCSDRNIRPYKNANGDVFPEEELVKAYQKWIGKPLCIDHKSSSVDAIRGIIVDTYYDRKLKRVIALCALDKVNYPDLARKVSSGYAASVSMGTAVGKAICSDCGTVARVAEDFCMHMKTKTGYGEINIDLSPIELSIVVNGADPKAKIKDIIAAANNLNHYIDTKKQELSKLSADSSLDKIKDLEEELKKLTASVESLKKEVQDAETTDKNDASAVAASTMSAGNYGDIELPATDFNLQGPPARLASEEFSSILENINTNLESISGTLASLKSSTMLKEAEMQLKPYLLTKISNILMPILNGLIARKVVSEKTKPNTEQVKRAIAYFSDPFKGTESNDLTSPKDLEVAKVFADMLDKGVLKSASSEPDPAVMPLFVALTDGEKDMVRKNIYQPTKDLLVSKGIITASETMTMKKESYFQGGGGLNEPTPGKPKYEKDKMNEDLRLHDDKQMVGQHNLDTGPVDGMHPGTDSSGQSDLERKKLLARAEETEQRSLRRAAALEKAKESLMNHKEAYFQGGGGVNEPTPGKVKYHKEPLNEKAREDLDKQMVGQKPFPGVGDVEGLHPSPSSADQKDELKRKEMLQRASLKLKFVKAANTDGTDNLGASAWHVYADDKLVMTASVDEITGGNADALYNVIATKSFGTDMFEKIKSLGFEKASVLYKKGQAVAGPGGQPGATPDATPPAPVSMDMGAGAPAMEEGATDADKGGDPKKIALDLAEQSRDVSSDLFEAVKALTDEKAEIDEVAPVTASAETLSLYAMRKELNTSLIAGMKKAIAELKEHESELKLIANILESDSVNESNKETVDSIVEDAIVDAKNAIADSFKLMGAFVKYARSAEALVKRAEMEEDLTKTAQDMAVEDVEDVTNVEDVGYHHDMDEDLEAGPHDEDIEKLIKEIDVEGLEGAEDEPVHMDMPVDDTNETTVELPAGSAVPAGAKAVTASVDLSTKEARAEYRAKLVAEAGEFNAVLDEAHPQGGFTTQLDVKPSDDLAKVEDLEEQHKAVMEVAQAPAKVRKEAEEIQKLIAEGKITREDVDALASYGADPEAVKYWKELYGEIGKEGVEFANALVKEHAKAEFEAALSAHKVKLARAYELTNEMVRKGIVADDASAISAQVDEVMKFNDEGYESMKRVIAKQSLAKRAMPQVGQYDEETVEVKRPVESASLSDDLARAFGNRKY